MTCALIDRDAIGSWPDPHGCADEQGEGEGDGSRGTVSGGGEPPAAALGPAEDPLSPPRRPPAIRGLLCCHDLRSIHPAEPSSTLCHG